MQEILKTKINSVAVRPKVPDLFSKNVAGMTSKRWPVLQASHEIPNQQLT